MLEGNTWRTAGRFHLGWRMEPRDPDGPTAKWSIYAAGAPALYLRWRDRRYKAKSRPIASLWVRADFGKNDPRIHVPYSEARDLLDVGPLPQHGVSWSVTWHTWDERGTGGENAEEPDLCSALEVTVMRLLAQRFITDVRADEVQRVLSAANELSRAWVLERGLVGMRWAYYGR